jgi:acetylornithine deacetylase/succinyl-diaminopimelate desuccinylase-like protein
MQEFSAQAFEEEALEIFKELVRINTSNPPGGETSAAHYLMGVLEAHGIESRCLERAPGRGNLIVRMSGGERPPLILLSHLDVVPAEAARWQHDPFSAEEAGGAIWGRGTLDTKQLTAMQVAALLRLNHFRERLNRDVYLVASADEENGSALGMEWLAGELPELLQPALIVSEGGGFPITSNGRDFLLCAAGEKGVCRVRITAAGSAGHASSPPADQAMFRIARALRSLCSYNFEEKYSRVTRNFLIETGLNPADPEIHCSTLGALTQHMLVHHWVINEIRAGSASNVIPGSAQADLELRILPGTSQTEIESLLERVFGDCDVEWQIVRFEEGYESALQCDLLEAFQRASRSFGFSGQVLPFLALGRTDGRFLASRGTSIYGFSPTLLEDSFPEVLKRVHGVDERIAVESFRFGARVLAQALLDVCVENGEAS